MSGNQEHVDVPSVSSPNASADLHGQAAEAVGDDASPTVETPEASIDDDEAPEVHLPPLTRVLSEASTVASRSPSPGPGPGPAMTMTITTTTRTRTTNTTERSMTAGHFVGAVANLCSATLGAGILALPFAVYESGLVFGLVLLLASAWGTAASIELLVQACDTHRLATYESVVEKMLGRTWRQVVEISILVFCGGTAVAYVIAVGDIMERLEDLSSAHKRLAMSMVWMMAMLPLSCLRRMQSLQCASSVGIISIGTLLVAATVHLLMMLPSAAAAAANSGDGDASSSSSSFLNTQDLELFLWPNHGGLSILRACPIFFFAFSCQVNVAQIYDELPGPRRGERTSEEGAAAAGGHVRNMNRVAWVSIGLCTLLYGSISLVTLLDFGDAVKPNVLSCYRLGGRESALLHLAFLAMALAVVLAFPLNIFPARVSLIQMWESASRKGRSADPMDYEEAKQPLLQESSPNMTKNTCYDNRNEASEAMERGVGEDPLQQPSSSSGFLAQQSSLSEDTTRRSEDEEEELPDFHASQHIFVTLLVAGSALGLALVVPNISVVFGLLGGTTSALLGFVVPGLLGLEMNRSNKSAWVLVVAGTLIGFVTTGVTLYSMIHDAMKS